MTSSSGRPRVLLTRALEDLPPLASRLLAAGAQVFALPCVRFEPCADAATRTRLDRALRSGREGDGPAGWVFASRQAVWQLAAQAGAPGYGTLNAPVAVVGPGTAAAVVQAFGDQRYLTRGAFPNSGIAKDPTMGGEPLLVAEPHTGEGLAATIVATWAHLKQAGPMWLPRALEGRTVVAETLAAAGFEVVPLVLYETIAAAQPPLLRATVDGHGPGGSGKEIEWSVTKSGVAAMDVVAFTSPSTVRGFLTQGAVPAGVPVVAMGPSTAAALRAAGVSNYRQAAPHTLDGLVEALLNHAD